MIAEWLAVCNDEQFMCLE